MAVHGKGGWSKSALVLASVLAPALSWAQQGYPIAGRVVDAATGAPLGRVTVGVEPVLNQSGQQQQPFGAGRRQQPAAATTSMLTASDGSFHFTDLPAGQYQLQATRRGYVSSSFQAHDGYYAAVVVGPNKPEASHLRFSLQPLAAINGTVLDSSGDPVQTATISLFAQSEDGTGSVRMRQSGALEGGNPTYSFANLTPGTYYLAVTATPWFAESGEIAGASNPLDVVYPLTFFDGSDSSASAQPLHLRAGETLQANFSLHAVPAVHIATAISQVGGGFRLPQVSAPAFGTMMQVGVGTVSAAPGAPGTTEQTMTVSVAPGTYQVSTDAGRSTIQATADVALGAAGGEPAPVGLSGRVAMADGSPLPGNLTLHLVPDLSSGQAPGFLRTGGPLGAGRGGQFGSRPMDLPIAADGIFTGKGVTPGDYQIRAASGPTRMLIVGAAASGAQVAADGRLQLGTESAMLAITVAPATGAATGLVVGADGKPESGAMVLLLPESGPGAAALPGSALCREDESDSDGTWTIRNLAAGTYLAIAIRDGWDLAWHNPGVLARYLGSGAAVPVTVSPSGITALPSALPVQAR